VCNKLAGQASFLSVLVFICIQFQLKVTDQRILQRLKVGRSPRIRQ
jgi:hypothetical protein